MYPPGFHVAPIDPDPPTIVYFKVELINNDIPRGLPVVELNTDTSDSTIKTLVEQWQRRYEFDEAVAVRLVTLIKRMRDQRKPKIQE